MATPNDRRYSREHHWVLSTGGGRARVGLTDWAQRRLGDLVMVELPEVDQRFGVGDDFGTVESVKTATEIYAPVTGRVVAVNEALRDDPGLVNDDPYGEGWVVEVELGDAKEIGTLLTAPEYDEFCREETGG